jgi:hypothetical protein
MTMREPDSRLFDLPAGSLSRRATLRDLGGAGLAVALSAVGLRFDHAAAETAGVIPGVTPSLASAAAELIYLPATEALALFRAKQLSPVEVLETQIAQIEARNTEVNAITFTHFDEARAAAKEAERRYLRGEPRVLEGITVGVKDDQLVDGWITTYGSVLFQDYRATENSPMIDKLAEAGAIFSIQTTVPEMMFHAATWFAVGCHPQSVESLLYPGRLLRWLGRGARGRLLHAGDGIGHGRFDPYPRLPVWTLRLQAPLRTRRAVPG